MDGGRSSSETKTDQSTTVTTTTKTDIGEIGLTGGDAVELANVLATANVIQGQNNTAALKDISASTVKGFEKISENLKQAAEVTKQKSVTSILAENAPLIVAASSIFLFLRRKK